MGNIDRSLTCGAAEGRPIASSAESGWVHSVETCGAADGPGLRYIVFLAGCALRCQYCHNPDSWHMRHGEVRNAADIIDDIGLYRGYIERTHGGVTISGGEPLVQLDFCRSLLQGAKKLGLHTALDTSGFLGARADDSFLDLVDLVLLDIKAFTEDRYREVTGRSLWPTLDFAERLAVLKKPIWLRYVLVPDLTDDLHEIADLAAFAAGLGNVARVDILPFHNMAAYKWEALGEPYRLATTRAPDPALVDEVRGIFAARGLYVPNAPAMERPQMPADKG